MKKILVGGAVTLLVMFILGMTTWNFAATQGAVQKKEHTIVHDKWDKKIDEIHKVVIDIYKEMPKK